MIQDNRLPYAVEQLVHVCESTEIELVVPSSFVADVIANSLTGQATIRQDFAEWLRGVVRLFPDLDRDARQTLLDMVDASAAPGPSIVDQ